MSAALELIHAVEANGGNLRVDRGWLVITPDYAAVSIIDHLRQHKGEIIRLLNSRKPIPACDPDAWREDFTSWVLQRCVLRDKHEDSQSLSSLLIDFAEWCLERDLVPSDRGILEALFARAGIQIKDGMTIGVILRQDLERVLPVRKEHNTTGKRKG